MKEQSQPTYKAVLLHPVGSDGDESDGCSESQNQTQVSGVRSGLVEAEKTFHIGQVSGSLV